MSWLHPVPSRSQHDYRRHARPGARNARTLPPVTPARSDAGLLAELEKSIAGPQAAAVVGLTRVRAAHHLSQFRARSLRSIQLMQERQKNGHHNGDSVRMLIYVQGRCQRFRSSSCSTMVFLGQGIDSAAEETNQKTE